MKKILNSLIVALSKTLLNKMQKQHSQKFNTPLKIVVVTGSVGKSTVTLMLNQTTEKAGLKVFSGTSLDKNYNTLTGLAMTLTEQKFSIDKTGRVKGGLIILKNLITRIFNVKIDKPSIVIAEIGVDHQGEMNDYLKIFPNPDFYILTAATVEHSGGYSQNLDTELLQKLKSNLPEKFYNSILNSKDIPLTNSILENLKLAEGAKQIILPEKIGEISNRLWTRENLKSNWVKIEAKTTRKTSGELQTLIYKNENRDGRNINTKAQNYFLPLTFARSYLIISEFQEFLRGINNIQFNLDFNYSFPVSRFGKFKGLNDSTIIDSTYNSDPESLSIFLSGVWEMKNINPTIQNILVLGEMRELGDNSTRYHEEILEKLEKNTDRIEKLFLIGEEWEIINFKKFVILDELRKSGKLELSRNSRKVGDKIKKMNLSENVWIWCKGSQNTIFCEEIVVKLLKNQEDVTKICRQSDEWKNIKSQFFNV